MRDYLRFGERFSLRYYAKSRISHDMQDYYAQPTQQLGNVAGSAVDCRMPSPLEALQSKALRLADELSETNDAIKALQDNPEVARVLELVGRALGRNRF